MLFEEEIKLLISLKQEGLYWDFKRAWYKPNNDSNKKGDLLIDIISMANNLADRDAYIIIGVDEHNDYSICDCISDEHRLTTQQITDFIRSKKFAGDYFPTVTVRPLNIGGKIIDVIVVHNSSFTPFFLMEDFGGLKAGVVYVRYQESNTRRGTSADIHQIEFLWRKRFGFGKSPRKRLSILLDDTFKWNPNFGNKKYAYHEDFPEYQLIQVCEFEEGWEAPAAFYLNHSMFFAPLNIMYHNTILYETELWTLDEMRVILPKPTLGFLENTHYWYYYFLLDSIEGKLLKVLTHGTLDISSRGKFFNQFLIFKHKEEKEDFDAFLQVNFNKYSDDLIIE